MERDLRRGGVLDNCDIVHEKTVSTDNILLSRPFKLSDVLVCDLRTA